jgi:Fibronectin type III domain
MILPFQLLSGSAHAAQVTLAWDANADTDLQAYKVYSGTTSRTYSCNTNVGKSTTCTISDLTAGTTYYFAVTALDTAGNESGYSSEVRYTVPTVPPPTPQSQELVISEAPYTSWSLGFRNTRMLYAQSFMAIGPRIESVTVALARYRSPNMPVTVSIRTSPGGSILASGQISPSQVTSADYRNPCWIKVTFSSPVSVTPGTSYFMVFEVSTGNYRNYYRVPLGKNTYAGGMAYQSAVTQRSDVDILSKIVFTQ